MSASARVERPGALGPWTGTVTVVDNIDVTYVQTAPNGSSATVHFTYHEQASYTLDGTTTAEGLYVATMTGSGVGTVGGTPNGPNICVVPGDPYLQWSYSGAANVAIVYANGAYVVAPQTVSTTVTTVSHNSACGSSDQTFTPTGNAPLFLAHRKPQGQAAPESTTALAGSQDFSITVINITTAGNGTVSWNLHRSGGGGGTGGVLPPGTPPTGTATGTVLLTASPTPPASPSPTAPRWT